MANEQNLILFRELVSCGDDIYTWLYNDQLDLLESNCPNDYLLDAVFRHCDFQKELFEYTKNSQTPLALSIPLGMVWIVVLEKDAEKLTHIHVIGPVFSTSVSTDRLIQVLSESYPADASLAYKWELARILEHLPVVSPLLMSRYAVMLHYCVTGEKLAASDINTLSGSGFAAYMADSPPLDRRETWMVEEDLLNKIRSGDLQYRAALNRANMVRNSALPQYSDPLRQARNAAIVFISLCTRAAIEGGLPTEQAYAVGNAYLQSVEACRTLTDVEALDNAMYDDFVRRAHKVRQRVGLSRPIRLCCEFIDFHAEEKLNLAQLAQLASYTEYYLSRKFKAEVGLTVNDYIRRAKVERAKSLLTTTEDSIQVIADRLNFSSRSHFADTFRELAGQPPAEYRNEKQRV